MGKEPIKLGPYELRVYIEYLREELLDVGQKMGLSHQLTIQASEKLDYFLNEYKKVNN
ncbi:aspartyl-phosphate phosphatase Spo0E family protein [Neobacillus cucumis]|uniref:Spo0E family sporulation regulatory protein-aspartic acid phosphatase n=1 Tax=Neobacillus cucumis TaxID=1740721 RepID=A0A2N5HNH8_9BACI|nr:aspartyl-phosphate phosphatase Spo0E family protein [Neobacillus cucumis]PLS07081.1 hypothetical protein CVD27_05200 [Neobacillus cucumis]